MDDTGFFLLLVIGCAKFIGHGEHSSAHTFQLHVAEEIGAICLYLAHDLNVLDVGQEGGAIDAGLDFPAGIHLFGEFRSGLRGKCLKGLHGFAELIVQMVCFAQVIPGHGVLRSLSGSGTEVLNGFGLVRVAVNGTCSEPVHIIRIRGIQRNQL